MNIKDLFQKGWPDILAVLLFIVDYTVKRLNDYAATHEHSTILVLLIAVLAAWHAQHLKPDESTAPPASGAPGLQSQAQGVGQKQAPPPTTQKRL